MAVINFPDPALQTPINTFSPTSTPTASSNGVTYVWTDGSWSVQASSNGGGTGGGIEEAPVDTKLYGRKDAAWSEITDGGPVDAADVTYTYPGGAPQTVQSKLEQYVSVVDFGAVGDGDANNAEINQAAFQAAIDASNHIYIPAGVYAMTDSIRVSKSDTKIEGAGAASTIIRCFDANINSGTRSTIDIRTSWNNYQSIRNVSVSGLTLDGNKNNTNHTGETGLMILVLNEDQGGGNFTNSNISEISVTNCVFINHRNSGLLLEGDRTRRSSPPIGPVLINNCRIADNDGVGLSQFKCNNATISDCIFQNNGLENLTVDIASNNCIVANNRFFKALGGTGNIGIDSGDLVNVTGNFIDMENTDVGNGPGQTTGVGIALNAQFPGEGGNTGVLINSNTIINCKRAGIIIHDDSDTEFGPFFDDTVRGPGTKGGDGLIANNTFRANTKDIIVEETFGWHHILGNSSGIYEFIEKEKITLESGEAVLYAGIANDFTFSATTAGNEWFTIPLDEPDPQNIRNIIWSNDGTFTVKVPGHYQVNAKIRIFSSSVQALISDYYSIGIGVDRGNTGTFGRGNVIYNFDLPTGYDSPVEIQLSSIVSYLQVGDRVCLQGRHNATQAEDLIIDAEGVSLDLFSIKTQ